jgi:chromosome segregation ATPase
MIREITGYGSYSSITEHLRTIRGESVGDEDSDGSPAYEKTALAVLDDTPVDLVQAAEGALQRAKERLAQAEAHVPELERQVAGLRQALLQATLQHLTVAYAASKGLLSTLDPSVADAERAMWEAGRAHRQAKERSEQAPQAIAAARGAVRIAQQQLFLAQHHPELAQRLADIEAQKPEGHGGGEHDYREWVTWKQSIDSVKAEIAQVIHDSWFAQILRGFKNCGRVSGAEEVRHGRDLDHSQ